MPSVPCPTITGHSARAQLSVNVAVPEICSISLSFASSATIRASTLPAPGAVPKPTITPSTVCWTTPFTTRCCWPSAYPVSRFLKRTATFQSAQPSPVWVTFTRTPNVPGCSCRTVTASMIAEQLVGTRRVRVGENGKPGSCGMAVDGGGGCPDSLERGESAALGCSYCRRCGSWLPAGSGIDEPGLRWICGGVDLCGVIAHLMAYAAARRIRYDDVCTGHHPAGAVPDR